MDFDEMGFDGYDFEDVAEAGDVTGFELVEIHANPRRRGRKKKKKTRRRRRPAAKPARRRRSKKRSNFDVQDIAASIGGALVAGYVGGEVIPKIQGLPDFIKNNVGAVAVAIGTWLALRGKTKMMRMLGVGMATGGAYALYMAWRSKALTNQLASQMAAAAAAMPPPTTDTGTAVAGLGWYPGGPALNASQAASLLGNNPGMNNPYGLQNYALAGADTYHSEQFPGYGAGPGMGSLETVAAGAVSDPSVDHALAPSMMLTGLGELMDADQDWQQDGYAYTY